MKIKKTPYIKLSSYLKESTVKSTLALNEVRVLNNIPLIFKDDLVRELDLSKVFDTVKKAIPEKFFYGIDMIYVGQFDEMQDRGINAFFKDSVIYISNIQDNEDDMIDDIIHEIAHVAEEQYGMDIYSDGKLESEFLTKRNQLRIKLNSHGYPTENQDFMEVEFDTDFDEYLNKDVGYVSLTSLTNEIFYSPYAATSLREYYANGFEAYFHKRDSASLKNISPALYSKLTGLAEQVAS